MQQKFQEKLMETTGDLCKKMEPMKFHTTFRVGGPAEYFVTPDSVEMIWRVTALTREYGISCQLIGNGSNLLVSDAGISGVVLRLGKEFSQIEISGTRIRAQAGSMLSAVARQAAQAGLSGMEFASGIPGTLGGAVTMNAGAYGGEMLQITEAVTVLTREGEIRRLTGEQMEFGYRSSIIQREEYVVLEAELRLTEDRQEKIEAVMAELNQRRRDKQPLEYPSAGSTFKRPEGYFAGKLIMDAGLAGFQVGGAQVSKKHCGFVINTGAATAADIHNLIQEVQRRVMENAGVQLEPEIRYLGW